MLDLLGKIAFCFARSLSKAFVTCPILSPSVGSNQIEGGALPRRLPAALSPSRSCLSHKAIGVCCRATYIVLELKIYPVPTLLSVRSAAVRLANGFVLGAASCSFNKHLPSRTMVIVHLLFRLVDRLAKSCLLCIQSFSHPTKKGTLVLHPSAVSSATLAASELGGLL